MRSTALLFCALVLTLVAPAAHANDGVFGGKGIHPMPLSTDAVRMADEIVTLRLDPTQDAWNVHCSFIFENTTDAPVTLKIGFPFPTAGMEGDTAAPKGENELREGQPMVWDFATTVRGKKVKAKRGKAAVNPARPDMRYDFAYYWEVTFAPRERVRIVNTYRHGVSAVVGGFVEAFYVVKTGTTWKGGKIGHARLRVQVPSDRYVLCVKDAPDVSTVARPSGWVESPLHGEPGFEVHWSESNFAPTEDVFVCIRDLDNYAMMHFYTRLADLDLDTLDGAALRLTRNTIYALHGYAFGDEALRTHFAKQWWYRPDPGFSPKRFSKDEREFVAAIRAKEKGRK